MKAVAPLAAGALVTLVALGQLFLGDDLGVADNGDAQRSLCWGGWVLAEPAQPERVRFALVPAPEDVLDECVHRETRYPSSFGWFLRGMGRVAPAAFDLRGLAVVLALLLGGCAACWTAWLPGGPALRAGLGVLAVLPVLDASFVAFFASGYAEGFAFVGMAWTALGAYGLVVHEGRPWAGALAHGASAVLSTTKAQFAPAALLGPMVAALGKGRRGWGRLAAAAGLLMAIALVASARHGTLYRRANVYHLVTTALLADSTDAERDLAELGLPVALAAHRGTHAWMPGSAYASALWEEAEATFSRRTAAWFLLRHPGRAGALWLRAVAAVGRPRLQDLANHEDGRRSERPAPVTWALGLVASSPWGLVLLWGALVITAARGVRSSAPAERGLAAAQLWLVLTAVTQPVVAVLGDGLYELERHCAPAALATALAATAGLVRALLRLEEER